MKLTIYHLTPEQLDLVLAMLSSENIHNDKAIEKD